MSSATKRAYNQLLFKLISLYFLLLFLICFVYTHYNSTGLFIFLVTVLDTGWSLTYLIFPKLRYKEVPIWPKWWKQKETYTTHDYEECQLTYFCLAILLFVFGLLLSYLVLPLETVLAPASLAALLVLLGKVVIAGVELNELDPHPPL